MITYFHLPYRVRVDLDLRVYEFVPVDLDLPFLIPLLFARKKKLKKKKRATPANQSCQ